MWVAASGWARGSITLGPLGDRRRLIMDAEISSNGRPFHLRGNYAPVDRELTALDLTVRGAIPDALDGLYLRNGPNPKSGRSGHWFLGDGMLHGVQLRAGRAS